MLLFYIRHGEPVYEPDSLTPLGEKQAEALSKRLAKYGLDEIYASVSNRAMLTAIPTAKLLNKPVIPLEWCYERLAWLEFSVEKVFGDKPAWVYQIEEFRNAFVSDEVLKRGRDWCTGKFSRFKDGINRISRETYKFLEELGYEYDFAGNCYKAVRPNEKKIALFAHEGFGMAFLSALTGVPYPLFCTHFGLGHSSMTVIRFDGNDNVIPCVLQLSNDSHLYKEGLPTNYNGEIYF